MFSYTGQPVVSVAARMVSPCITFGRPKGNVGENGFIMAF